MVTGSLLDQRLLDGDVDLAAARAISVLRLPSGGAFAELLFDLAISPDDRVPLLFVGDQQLISVFAAPRESFACSALISISSSLRNERSRILRIASACMSVRPNAVISRASARPRRG